MPEVLYAGCNFYHVVQCGRIIPTYLNFKDFGLLNTRTAIILGFAINTYNMVIMKSFFEQVPYELEEAAFIDGANHFTIFYKIFLPLSKPALATVGLFYAVNRWNSYFWAMQLLTDDTKAPLQVMLKKMIVDRVANASDAALVTAESLSSPDYGYLCGYYYRNHTNAGSVPICSEIL